MGRPRFRKSLVDAFALCFIFRDSLFFLLISLRFFFLLLSYLLIALRCFINFKVYFTAFFFRFTTLFNFSIFFYAFLLWLLPKLSLFVCCEIFLLCIEISANQLMPSSFLIRGRKLGFSFCSWKKKKEKEKEKRKNIVINIMNKDINCG